MRKRDVRLSFSHMVNTARGFGARGFGIRGFDRQVFSHGQHRVVNIRAQSGQRAAMSTTPLIGGE
jgi:predicted SpoU family rRNA methylase